MYFTSPCVLLVPAGVVGYLTVNTTAVTINFEKAKGGADEYYVYITKTNDQRNPLQVS